MEKHNRNGKTTIFLIIFVVVGLVMTATPVCMAEAVIVIGKSDGRDIEKDSKGHLHMAYQDEFEPGSFEIFYTNNIGLKKGEWNPSTKITDTLSDSIEPDFGIDSISGTMFITWTEVSLEGNFIYTSISRDKGKSWSEPRKMDYEILIKADVFDPLFEEPEIPSELKIYESQEYYLVQLISPLNQEWYDTLQVIDGTIYSYIPNNAFLVKMSEDVKKVVEDMPYVRWVGLYHPAYKIDQGLMENSSRIEVNVVVFRDDGSRENIIGVTNEIKALGGKIIHDGKDNYIIVAEINAEMIDELAFIPDVAWIDESSSPIPCMNYIRDFTGAKYLQTPPLDFDGGGYIVGEVKDTGIDLTHPDLSNIVYTHGTADESYPMAEHGTCTSGIVFSTGANDENAKGMLPEAVGAFANMYELSRTETIVQLHTWEGVFQSNSWFQGDLNSQYSTYSMEDDLLIFTYDITMVYSAGNSDDGVGPKTLSQDSVAKNVIGVGGLNHQNTPEQDDDRWVNGGVGNTPGQGPSADERIKPDIAGPSDWIYTTDSVDGDGNDGYVVGNYISYFGLTSGATAVVSGASGIVNQMYMENWFENNPIGAKPNAATVKALLINSAHQIDINNDHSLDSSQGDSRYQQGWGMVDLDRIHDSDLDHLIVDEASNLQESESDTYTIHVRNSLKPLKISLVWTDPPGSYAPAIRDVYNNLDLKVTDLTTGTIYWGNNGLITSKWSSPGGTADSLNNVENVFIENPTSGPWQIEIIAQTINADGDLGTPELDQNYALVASYFPALEVPLIEGWQLISLPLDQEDTTLEMVLRSIDPYYDAVQYFDAHDPADPWKHWKRDKPPGMNDLTDLNHEMGFYIYILGIPEITFYVYGLDFPVNFANYVPVTLYDDAGIWNMVGYPSNKVGVLRDAALNNLLYGIDIDSVWIYGTSLGVERKLKSTEYFELGRGYWFAMILPLPSPPEWEVLIDP
ncbi:MAG: S8 family serine peptidase [Methanomassiliicoccales archaeon]|nr:MAG: S8 family serine peptidase [Methanomassiliicoccales archaeon]